MFSMLLFYSSLKQKNMNIVLTYPDLYATVERTLSIVGKRSTDDNGNLLFRDITLGTREVTIIHDYLRQAIIDLTTELSAFITGGTDANVTFTLTLPTNHNANLETFIQDSCAAYCVSWALYSWFTITAPRIAEKYLEDCRRELAAVIRLSNIKQAPSGNTDILTTSTEVVSN